MTSKTKKTHEKHVKSIADTKPGTTWQEFIEIAEAYGFKCGLRQNFTGNARQGGIEEEIIFFHEEKGLILYAHSYDQTCVNDAMVYGEVRIKEEELSAKQLHALYRPYVNENNTCSFSVQVVYGLFSHLDAISEVCEFSKTWSTKNTSLWLLNYMDVKVENHDREKINQHKIDVCTPEVRKIIFG